VQVITGRWVRFKSNYVFRFNAPMRKRLEAAATAPRTTTVGQPDAIDQLRRLRDLRDRGTISGPEYERARGVAETHLARHPNMWITNGGNSCR